MSITRTRLMAAAQKRYIALTYKVTDASTDTQLFPPYANLSGFPQTMTVDGTEVPLARSYRFGAAGVHTVLLAADGIASIPNSAFQGCTALASVGDLSSVTGIGEYAFFGCTSLASVGDLSSVTSIGGNAFRGCSALTSVGSLSSVTSIGNGAFLGCAALTEFVLSVAAPPQLGTNVFHNTNFSIYVPDAALEAYRTATNWSAYAARIHPMSELNH